MLLEFSGEVGGFHNLSNSVVLREVEMRHLGIKAIRYFSSFLLNSNF
jgi:hypothetical protein